MKERTLHLWAGRSRCGQGKYATRDIEDVTCGSCLPLIESDLRKAQGRRAWRKKMAKKK